MRVLSKTVIAVGVLVSLAACGSGGGSTAGAIDASVAGDHKILLAYTRPGGDRVEAGGQMSLGQDATGNLSGQVLVVESINQKENCFRGGSVDSTRSSVTGTRFTITWNEADGDAVTVSGDINGRNLSAIFNSTGAEGSGCSARSGEFESTF